MDVNETDTGAEVAGLKVKVGELQRHVRVIEMKLAAVGLVAVDAELPSEEQAMQQLEQNRLRIFGPLETTPIGNDTTDGAHASELERRLQKIEAQLVELMAHHELDRERARQLVEHHLGRVPTDDDIERLARGEEVPRTRSVAAA
jgi:hypothetical protein